MEKQELIEESFPYSEYQNLVGFLNLSQQTGFFAMPQCLIQVEEQTKGAMKCKNNQIKLYTYNKEVLYCNSSVFENDNNLQNATIPQKNILQKNTNLEVLDVNQNIQNSQQNLQNESQIKIRTFDDILTDAQFGKYHIIIFIMMGLIGMTDGAEALNLSMVLPIMEQKEVWGISNFQEAVLGSAVFSGYFLGSLFSGSIADNIGRKKPIIYSSILVFVFSLISAFSPNFTFFIILRTIFGVLVGFAVPISFTILAENLPLKQRGASLILIGVFYTAGELYACMLAALTMDSLTSGNWRLMLALNSVPSFFLILAAIFFLKESPRFLVIKNKESDGVKVLQEIIDFNEKKYTITETDQQHLQLWSEEIRQQTQQEKKVKLKQLFVGKFKIATPIIWYNWFAACLVYFGISFLLPLTLEQINDGELENNNSILSITISCLGELPSIAVLAVVIHIPYLGRKNSWGIAFFTCFIALLFVFFEIEFVLFIAIAKSAINASFTLAYEYTGEVYPTSIRATGLGLASGYSRIGGIIMPWITLIFAILSSIYFADIQKQQTNFEKHILNMDIFNNAKSKLLNQTIEKPRTKNQYQETQQLGKYSNKQQQSQQSQHKKNLLLQKQKVIFKKHPEKHSGISLAQIDCNQVQNPKKVFIGQGTRWAKIRKYFNSRCDYQITNQLQHDVDFIFAETFKQARENFIPGKQIINRIPQVRKLLSKKDSFAKQLKKFDKKNIYSFNSTEFHFKSFEFDLSSNQYNQEEQYFMEKVNDGFWVSKDPLGQNGYGIVVYKSPQPIKDIIKQQKSEQNYTENQENSQKEKQKLYVEEYMHNPFLWDGKKIDHRSFALIASTDPLVVLYQDGFVKRCIENYDNDFEEFDIQAIYKHITNRKQYRGNHPKFDELENDLILTVPALQDYMIKEHNFTEEKFQELQHQKHKMMAYCIMAAIKKIDKKQGAYQLLGFDLIWDENFNVKIIEINTYPEIDGFLYAQKYVYPTLIQTTLDLMIDTLQDPSQTRKKWENPQKLDLGNWEIIINEAQNYNILDKYKNQP
ncbi:Major facilitator superfamily domain, general substrate transporter [Pseudocohnilembus persalinus]|uniref:Major facilitator superfamily domain, general substrate transporter n=1 Tax=Pseudocohnilembus persalinus TaxID=266149 RepID=A0A0V0R0R7_PSEPJ|nr:Major facilitator superfamily domain, general substrate transporter [Pseudocohnilembus persalinus]|eukprot:KRX07752.1 Major facilitator superfamily domain, general substrate transporter [Pseudocohnilembus persalinus]